VRRLTLLAAALAVAVVACGGDGEERGAGIELSGDSSRDEEIARDLRIYIERGCRRLSSLEEWRASIARAEEPPPPVLRTYLARRYGGVDRAFESFSGICQSYRAIRVGDGVITVETELQGNRAKLLASDVCDTIQGSDVADFTRGHRVLGEDGSELAKCPARSG
jgi:hypothetical protein